MNTKIYILLPVHNRKAITANFIRFLKKQRYTNYHLVLIDDGSTDGTAELVTRQIENLTIIKGKGDWWWGGALHQGYKWIKKNRKNEDSFVLIINDDTEFDINFLKTGIELIKDKPGTIIQAEPYQKKSGKNLENDIFYDYKKLTFSTAKKKEDINCLTTRGLLMNTDDFIKIGGFYPTLLPHYLSDIEYTIRASRKGMKLTKHPDFKLVTLEDETGFYKISEKTFINFLKKQYEFKNMMNPLHWISFVFLTCPFPYNFKNLILLIKREYFLLTEEWLKQKNQK